MRGRIVVILLALLLVTACAAAEGGETAAHMAAVVTQASGATVNLYALPDENAVVLMEYYSGAPLEVVRPVGGRFYQVQVGDEAASVMGYIRAQDLAVGGEAARQVQPCFMKLEFNREAQVYAYCDEGSQVIGMCELGRTYYAMSKNEDKWVQLFLPPQPHLQEEEDRMTSGFVHLETGMARGYWQELQRWEVQPADGDISRDQAVEMAIAYLENGERLGIPEVYKGRAELEAMPHRAYLSMTEGDEHPTVWFVYFWEKEGNDAVYVILNVSNGELLGASESYISPDSWSAYGISPVL